MVTHFVTAPSFIFLLKFSCFAESAEVFFGSGFSRRFWWRRGCCFLRFFLSLWVWRGLFLCSIWLIFSSRFFAGQGSVRRLRSGRLWSGIFLARAASWLSRVPWSVLSFLVIFTARRRSSGALCLVNSSGLRLSAGWFPIRLPLFSWVLRRVLSSMYPSSPFPAVPAAWLLSVF